MTNFFISFFHFDRYFDLDTKCFKIHLLCCQSVEDSKAKTTRDTFFEVIKNFNLNDKVKQITTDNCITMVSAFDNETQYEATDTDDESVEFDTELNINLDEDDFESIGI